MMILQDFDQKMTILIDFDDKTKGIPLDLHSLVTSKGILPAHFAKYRVFPETVC